MSSRKKPFGLDISDLSIKVVQFKKKGKTLDVASLVNQSIPAGLIENGEIKNEDELAKRINQAVAAVKGTKINHKLAVCNLPEEEIFIRVIQIPKMKEEEITQALTWEIENHIPLKADEVYLDAQVISQSKGKENKMSVLLAAAPKPLVDSYLSLIRKAGFEALALEPESMALVRALIKEQKQSKPTLIIDLGETGSNFVIYSGLVTSFTSRFKVCGQMMTNAIAQGLKVSPEEAKKFKIQYGLVKEENVYRALEPVIADLAKNIKDSINYYIDHIADIHHLSNNIEEVILCGGDSLLIGLPEYLSQKLVLPVKFGNPWINIAPLVPKNAQKLGLNYKASLPFSVAFGLGLREFL